LERLAERLAAPDIDAMRLSFINGGQVSAIVRQSAPQDDGHCLPPQALNDPLRRLMYADQLDYLPDDILVKLDRSAMSVGLETRVPLLDPRVIEFSWRLSSFMLHGQGAGKRILRHVLYRYVPRALVDRRKQGFSPPLAAWLRGPLKDWADALLSKESLVGYPIIHPAKTREVWLAHLAGRIDASQALWNVLMLGAWKNHARAEF
jgi:asparagine synthase (glutamine-hydrolysing)